MWSNHLRFGTRELYFDGRRPTSSARTATFGETGDCMRAGIITLSLSLMATGSMGLLAVEPEDVSTEEDTAVSDPSRNPTPPEREPSHVGAEPSAKSFRDGEGGEPSAFRTISSGQADEKRIALTFDDGPHFTLTPKVLDVLLRRGVKATFFVLGERVKFHPRIVSRIVAEGHEIGNHTYSHHSLASLSTEEIDHEISETQSLIKQATGFEPRLFRPPYGEFRSNAKPVFTKYGLSVIMWSVDSQDWHIRDADRVHHMVTSRVRNGSIVLLHDIHPSTLAALPGILDTLRADGYQFATVNELCDLPPLVRKREDPAQETPSPIVMHETQE